MTKPSVIITGASGFLGKYIFDRYIKGESNIVSIGRQSVTNSHLHINCDLSESVPDIPNLPYDKVIHVAGRAHVFSNSKEDDDSFYNVNVKGTLHLLEALDKIPTKPKTIVFISSVAVYGRETGSMITENEPLVATSAYGKTKIEAENLIKNWAIKNNVHYLLLRLPLIAGANPPGNFGKIKNAIQKGHYLRLKGNIAQKSIVVAPDVAELIYHIQNTSGVYNLSDGINPPFYAIENAIENRLGRKIKITIPFLLIQFLAKIGDGLTYITGKQMIFTSGVLTKINSDLTFDDSKARKELSWNPSSALEFIEKQL